MQSETKERWILLCEQAATEQDSRKMVELIQEINRLLEEKRSRLNKKRVNEYALCNPSPDSSVP
jgi:predicted nucleotidyltransferase